MRRSSPRWKPNNFIALFATFLVVGGIVAVAFVAAPQQPKKSNAPAETSRTVTTSTAKAITKPVVWIVQPQGSVAVNDDGTISSVSWPTEVQKIGRPFWSFYGVDTETGERVLFDKDFKRASSALLYSPSGQSFVEPSTPKADGTSRINIQTKNMQQMFVLRRRDGIGLRDAKLIGWWDNKTIALSALATTTRALYAVTTQGVVKKVSDLPDFIERLRVFDGAAWYVTVTPGEGIEQPDAPPSAFHRVSLEGHDDTLVQEEKSVIGNYTVESHGFAYQLDPEGVRWTNLEEGIILPLKDAVPLVYLDDGSLILRHMNALTLYNVVDRKERVIARISASTTVFLFPHATSTIPSL